MTRWKKFVSVSTLLCAAVILCSVSGKPVLAAQNAASPSKPSATVMSPNPLKDRLGLMDDQVAKFQVAQQANWKVLGPIIAQRREAMQTLSNQVQSQAAGSEIQKTLDQLTKIDSSINEQQKKFRSVLTSILTPVQQAKFWYNAGVPQASVPAASAVQNKSH